MLTEIDKTRLRISEETEAKKKSQFGQFLTPATTARFMASLFSKSTLPACRLLDPGAGIGSLASAFLERWVAGGFGFKSVDLTAFEIDTDLREALVRTLSLYEFRAPFAYNVVTRDFVEAAVNRLHFNPRDKFTHAILNPLSKKINTRSHYRLLLREVGIETVNLYSAFVALALALLCPGGQLVAIVPRSFCNGPYYRPFRGFILKRAAIRHLHLFASRDKAFKDYEVLQENVIIMLERNGEQQDVMVSTSTDDSLRDYSVHQHAFGRIVFPADSDRFVHVPTSPEQSAIELFPAIRYTLDEIGVMVSTGPVIDFRLRQHIRQTPEAGTVPLLYPGHFSGKTVGWLKEGMKKPNAIHRNADTEKWLYPVGFYCVVRRFSSKEKRRRIVANVVDPGVFPGATALGFENHLNVLHKRRKGLSEVLAHGLGLPFTHNSTGIDTPGEQVAVAQQLKVGIALPYYWMPGGWISLALQVPTERGDKQNGLS